MRILGATALLVALVGFIVTDLLHAQITNPLAIASATGALTRTDDGYAVGPVTFTVKPGVDFDKFLGAKLGRKVTVTIK